MHINDLPEEILNNILLLATRANEAEGVTFTYAVQHEPIAWLRNNESKAREKYVRGPLPVELVRWDSTSEIRHVCSAWHEWAAAYSFKEIYERRWQGSEQWSSERWVDLTMNRKRYDLYENNPAFGLVAVRRDPFGSLKHTDRLFAEVPAVARHVRRLWLNDFHDAASDRRMLSTVSSCPELEILSVPWTVLRRGTAEDWIDLLNNDTGTGTPLKSLELKSLCLKALPAKELEDDETPNPLRDPRVDFSALERLKIFGNTLHKPICDEDLHLIARTATNLKCLDFTNLSTITVEGMLALVRASRDTLRVLEHSPRSDDGFYHPNPGHIDEHICDFISHLPQMRDLSFSTPHMCAALFANHEVKWTGECQVRTLDVCGCSTDATPTRAHLASIRATFDAARALIAAKARVRRELNIEIFYAGCIFEPGKGLVHGDFAVAEVSSGGQWPRAKRVSTKGPYGSTGVYGRKEGSWEAVGEEEWVEGVEKGWISLKA